MRLSFQAIENWQQYASDLSKISSNLEPSQWQEWQQAAQLYSCTFNQRVVAYCVASSNKQQLMVQRFHVRDITQRRGIGLFMFQQLLQLAAQKDLSQVTFPHSNDPGVLGFYQHLGLNNQFTFQL
ncbi:acetyl-CoA sensor PanZ family protein [Agarivorans sp. Alg241-V36]|uniref:acetyl-CoA sensor PanZ family protein n=1 Tax=Agarivorans sp. Alg241-V36 TaxID=2305992 RepID=UPI0013D25976|nr:acetyl-CoA sensor PanZ family protein [Agarivorans sp. Alg241-V36]